MQSTPIKLKIRDAITLCSYSPAIKQELVKFLESNFGSQKHKLYVFARNDSAPKLFLLQLQIPAKFNGNSYDIALLVYFPLSFPEIEPEVFFQKIGKVKINPNCVFYVDEETLKVNYSCFYPWEKSFESFKGLVNELHNQFNIAFPIFNLSNDKDGESTNIDGDCVLKKNLCQEVELIAPPPSQNNIKNNINIVNNMMSNMNLNKKQPLIEDDNINANLQKNYNTNININNMNNNKNYRQPPVQMQPNNKNIAIHFDESKARQSMIQLLSQNLSQKIRYSIQPIQSSYLKLEKIKTDLNNKLKELSVIENKSGVLSQTLNSVKKELDTYSIAPSQEGMDHMDFTNLDSLLIISNKEYFMRLAKEKALEEYILIAKKQYEKQNMDFGTVLNLIRTNSRNIFFLKYKNAHPNSY